MKFDTRGMQASGMTTSQINDAIRQQEANMPKVIQNFKSQVNPQNVVAAPVKTPVKQPVKQPVKPQVMQPIKPRPPSPIRPTPVKPQVMPPAKPQSVSGKNLYEGRIDPYEEFAKKGYVGDRNPKINLPSEGSPAPNEALLAAQQKGIMGTGSQSAMMKKGGEAKKYTKGGKINLDACGVSTAQKSKSSPKW